MPRKSPIEDRMQKVSSAYLDNTVLRAAVSGIPHIGGTIDTLFAGGAAKAQNRRIMEWLDDLRVACSKLEDEKIDREFLHSEEFEAVFFETADKVRRTREAEKRRLFRNILVNACLKDFKLADKEYLAKKLDDLTMLHVEVLRLAREHQKPDAYAERIVSTLGRDRMYEIAVAINDLEKHGLVYITQGKPLHKPLQAVFHVTAFGQQFIRFLSEPV